MSETLGVEEPGLESWQTRRQTSLRGQSLDLEAAHPAALPNMAGNDERDAVVEPDDLQSYPLRTIVHIELEVPNGFATELYSGTGFLVGPRHVLTNHHVVIGGEGGTVAPNELLNMDPLGFLFQVYPGRSGTAIFNGGGWNVERVVWGPNAWNGLYWGGEDYALLILEDDPDRSGVLGRVGMCSQVTAPS